MGGGNGEEVAHSRGDTARVSPHMLGDCFSAALGQGLWGRRDMGEGPCPLRAQRLSGKAGTGDRTARKLVRQDE